MTAPGTPCEPERLYCDHCSPALCSCIWKLRDWLRTEPRPWVWIEILDRMAKTGTGDRVPLIDGIEGLDEKPTVSDFQRWEKRLEVLFPDGQTTPGFIWSHSRRSKR